MLRFTAKVAGTPFSGATTIINEDGNLDGSVVNTQANQTPVKRVDTITLTGTYGTANLLCDEVTEEVTYGAATTSAWNTRGGSEDDVITELIGGEIGAQFGRPRHLIDMTLYEDNDFLDIVGNLQDSLNQYSAVNRKFIINRASYNVKSREWDLGLNELI